MSTSLIPFIVNALLASGGAALLTTTTASIRALLRTRKSTSIILKEIVSGNEMLVR
jgi:hypothetical protein